MKNLTLGSLFDGIGGFPFAAELSGITPVWASEIEPFCIAVISCYTVRTSRDGWHRRL